MKATFLGGPLDGQIREMDRLVDEYWHLTPILGRDDRWVRAIYVAREGGYVLVREDEVGKEGFSR